jgi:septum formation protein
VLILASHSPQRRAILETLGVPFEVRPADIEEIAEGLPNEAARHNALAKARAAAGGEGLGGLGRGGAGGAAAHDVVLGVDTLVTLDYDIYGKPRDADHARGTLRALSGVTHTVVSAVAVIAGGSERVALASTEVTFRPLDEPTIDWYLASEEWRDRAGGYAIQGRGAALVERIHGDYTNVVGLPVALLLELVPDLLSGGQGGS